MARLASYFISGVWKDDKDNITHVLLHIVDENNTFQYGVKTEESKAINLLKQGYTIITITWGYPGWEKGAKVTYVNSNNREYLRTVANASIKDNLDNSIDMNSIR